MNRKIFNRIYNVMMATLAIISIALLILDYANEIALDKMPYSIIDNGILFVFAIDYFSRLIIAKNKKQFFVKNIFDLLSIIPANGIFTLFRINRVSRLFRLLRVLRAFRLVGLAGRLERFLKINGLLYYLYVSIVIVLLTSALYCISERVSFGTAIWWSIVTSTTVGYGDISPTTFFGKIAAVINMLVGIGMIGMLTSSITSVFAKSDDEQAHEISELKKQNALLLKKINHIEKLLNEHNQ